MHTTPVKLATFASLLLASTGCLFANNDATGEWTGSCELSSMGYDYILDVELDMEDTGGDLTGTAVAIDTYQIPFMADIIGTRKGKNVEFDLLPQYDTMTGGDTGFTFGTDFGLDVSFEGTKKKDTIEGECQLVVFMFALSGDMVLERL